MKELLRLSDFEWASVTRYVTYVAQVAEIAEVSADAVYSFPYATLGADKLHARKTKLLGIVKGNIERLVNFVERNDEILDEHEKAVLRSVYMQFKAYEELLQDHLNRIVAYRRIYGDAPGMFEEELEDVIPF